MIQRLQAWSMLLYYPLEHTCKPSRRNHSSNLEPHEHPTLQTISPGKEFSRFNQRGSVKWRFGLVDSGQHTSFCGYLSLFCLAGMPDYSTDASPRRQIFHIRRSFKLLSREKQQILRSTRQRIASGKHDSETSDLEKRQLQAIEQKKLDLKNDCWVQAGYLPLTAHW